MRKLSPGSRPLKGTLEVPGDKSIAHRALILGSLAEGEMRILSLPAGGDVRSTRDCLSRLGADLSPDGEALVLRGRGLSGLKAPAGPLDCGNSGTTMRLLMGLLAGQGGEAVLTGDPSLSRRPMRRVSEPLTLMGAAFELAEDAHAPIRIRGRRPLSPLEYRLPVPSAQVKSAILLAALQADGETTLDDPFGTRDHTERMLRLMGGPERVRLEGTRITLRPGPLRCPAELRIPGDPSSAAYWAAAASLIPGSALTVKGVLLNPTRMCLFDVLRDMGARLNIRQQAAPSWEPVGDIRSEHSRLVGVRVPAARIPALVDEVPLLAVIACAAHGETRIEGLAELRVKESDRLKATADGLNALGGEVRVADDALVIQGPRLLRGAAVETHGDHRLALAFAVVAAAAEGTTTLSDAECAAVSYPGFLEALEARTA